MWRRSHIEPAKNDFGDILVSFVGMLIPSEGTSCHSYLFFFTLSSTSVADTEDYKKWGYISTAFNLGMIASDIHSFRFAHAGTVLIKRLVVVVVGFQACRKRRTFKESLQYCQNAKVLVNFCCISCRVQLLVVFVFLPITSC